MSLDKRLEETSLLLKAFGFDAERSNERSARVLLALLQLGPTTPWSEAKNPRLGVRAIADWIRDHLEHSYAENSRESIRRFTLHQFLAAGFLVMNEDEPGRPRNSGKTNYKVVPEALTVIYQFGKDNFESLIEAHLILAPGLTSIYGAPRMLSRIPVILPDGQEITLDAGGQNFLIKAIIEDFCEYFTPGGEVVYIGDAESKLTETSKVRLGELGIQVDSHGKLPDVIVYQADKNWLFLIEAASTHGPVDAHRYGELKEVFKGSICEIVYVSCFPDRATMRGYLSDLAWETEVWNAAEPTHLIHLNGSRFLGPY